MIFRGKYKKTKQNNRKMKQAGPEWFEIEQEAGIGDRCGRVAEGPEGMTQDMAGGVVSGTLLVTVCEMRRLVHVSGDGTDPVEMGNW